MESNEIANLSGMPEHISSNIVQFAQSRHIKYTVIDRTYKKSYTMFAAVNGMSEIDFDRIIHIIRCINIRLITVIVLIRWTAPNMESMSVLDLRLRLQNYDIYIDVDDQFHQRAYDASRGLDPVGRCCVRRRLPWGMIDMEPCARCPETNMALYIIHTLGYMRMYITL
jgi:hypothetical protein